MTDDELRATVQRLEARVAALEDQVALYQLISSYGPAVDSGSADAVAAIWTEDGTYDTFPAPLNGRDAIRAMVVGDGHQGLIRGGCAHVMAMPMVSVEGDRATATGYSRVYVHGDDGFGVWRASANRWEFERGADGWHAVHRLNRALDGDDEARQILRDGIADRTA
ncbi:MAG TPA: nuclear transport factor 2 family protein [Acidimicrobiales bacterium]|jgi:ketosteroid isomerase-like protein